MVENKKINAGLYIRVSTEKQVKEGYSVSAQKDNLIRFSKQQNWNIFDTYADEGISGKNIKDRPEVKRLINDIKLNFLDVVVLYRFDRLTRDSKDTEEIIELIQQFGIQVFTLSGGAVDVSTATGRFAIRINGAVAQLEREQTIERIKVALEQKVKQGYTLACATTCYGYDRKLHEKEQTINVEEAEIVKKIFKMYIKGKTITQICNFLNTEKIPTKKAGRLAKKRGTNESYIINSVWMPKTIKLILTNPTYIGKVRYHINRNDGFVIDGKHKPIITKKIWEEVQNKINQTKHIHRTNIPKEDVYYCGTLICGICGQKLTTNRTCRIKKDGTKVKYNGYRCINREKKICTCLGMSHKKVEIAFENYMNKFDDLTEFNKINIQKDENIEIELESLKKSLLQVNNKKKEIMNLFILNNIDYEQLNYMTKKLDKKISMLNDEILKLKNELNFENFIDMTKISTSIKEHWKYLNNKEKYEFLNNFISEIVIVNTDSDKIYGKPRILNVNFYE